MDSEKIEEATALFKSRFGKTPDESGYPVIDIYPKGRAYLFGKTEKAVRALKTMQDIIRWLLYFSLWPLVLDIMLLVWVGFAMKYHQVFIATTIFAVCWCVLMLVLCYKGKKADKQQKGKVIWLNY